MILRARERNAKINTSKGKQNKKHKHKTEVEKMLNVGVIGCGGMGKDHIKRLTEKIQGAQVFLDCIFYLIFKCFQVD